ncbi:hypothetical protein [Desulfitobacterium hafniense]|uniref:Uncharacterized protein n=2 Tax=Desulfitobacterium hafniense TaxID=49338 RepID=Q24ZA7_DESHY|nr:hypothetical protein [Desulfitobacterium hafniense]BAE82635.1 hypothetical protein DSY0846 [Desulfitobacterium hafniense Y51]CDX00879.1 Hypothetical protein DPCES_0992 [Desulfitobacterium hafniense]
MIQLQDLTAIIKGTSRFNGGLYDSVHVEILLQTVDAIPPEAFWYVPAGVDVPPVVKDILSLAGLPMYPQSAAKLLEGVDDIKQQAETGNLQDVINDSARLMMLATFKKMALTPVPGATNAYVLSYDYKLYPIAPNTFEMAVMLPFDGLELNPSGGRVEVTVITPIGANVDPANTKGIAPENPDLPEIITPVNNTRRQVVSFEYHKDPEFRIRYTY